VRSIIAIIAGVERTDDAIVPPTSVSSRPSTSNSVTFSIPTSSESPIGGGTIHWRAVADSAVCIVGGTGALGFGLALPPGQAGARAPTGRGGGGVRVPHRQRRSALGPRPPARRGHPAMRRQPRAEGPGGRARAADRRASSRRLRAARDGADRRAAHAADHLDQ